MRPAHFQKGLSLVELMIAMALSMLLMLGALQMFLSSKQTYTANSSLSRVQESGRFAMEFIGYDLRNAGYRGECLSPVNALISSPNDPRYDLNQGIQGWEAQENLPNWPANFSTEKKAGTDSIIIKHAAISAGTLNTTNTINADAASIPVQNGKAQEDDYVVISNALGCDIFPSAANSETSITQDSGSALSRDYFPDITKVLLFQSHQYFIKNNIAGQAALFRASCNNGGETVEELVEGIYDLQFEYAIGTGEGKERAASNADYVKADAVSHWEDIVAVRVKLLALGNEHNVSPEAQVYDQDKGIICKTGDAPCAATSLVIPNRRLAQAFSATVSLRNQLP